MKKKWIDVMQHADDKYIEEADPTKAIGGKRRPHRRALLVAAACICLMSILLGVFVVMPYFQKNSIRQYRDSEYYVLIQKLNQLKKETIKGDYTTGGSVDMEMAPGAPEGSMDNIGSNKGEVYEEITDNQVSGIVEGDRIKRSDKYIYYLTSDGTLNVYSIEGENAQRVGKYKVTVSNGAEGFSAQQCEIYLSKDCKTVTVMMPIYSYDLGMNCLRIKQLDVSDPAAIKEKNEVTVGGNYKSSRLTDGKFLVITDYSLLWDDVDYGDETTFVPQIEGVNGRESIAPDRIVMPEKLSDAYYTVVALLDGESMETLSSAAFLSYSEEVYVSAENIFAARRYSDIVKKGNLVTTKSHTEISMLSYKESDFEPKGSVHVEGYIKDRYSLDEKNGILRAVTTTDISQYRETSYGGSVSSTNWHSTTSANLYCIDLSEMKVAAEVVGFAPSGETVQSVRYKGDYAYVCTAVVFTDPVFFFDLSDITNITYKETEEIEGFSSSLVDFENGKLLGIGRTDWSTLKIEIYEEGEEEIKSLCKYQLQDVGYSTDYKAYYIDRENQLLGLGVRDYSTGDSYYILLHFDGNKLEELIKTQLKGDPTYQRGFYKDGFLYMCGESDFKVKELNLK